MKTIYSAEYLMLLGLLRKKRIQAGLTQVQLAKKVGSTQSSVGKIERGERRLDILELRRFCLALGITLTEFVSEFEQQLPPERPLP